ncbi:MAG: potassium channel family protein [Dehalococcoidia bacterium]
MKRPVRPVIIPIAPERRLLAGVFLLAGLLALGIVGYILIEGWSFLDALYMTVTTVTTVGFREVKPLSDEGRVFTIFLILFGVGAAFYILTALVALVVEGDLGLALGLRRMKGKIEALRDHHILCGFGRVGEEIAREFRARGVPFVVVDSNPEAIERARKHGYLLVEGDASSDATLLEAGIERARCLLAASDSDSGNTYIVLTAKALNPRLFVVARAGQPASMTPMVRAGAERVISPYSIGGRRMALSALQPLVVDFIETLAKGRHGEQILAELEVSEGSGLAGMTIEGCLRDCRGAVVLAVQKASGDVQVGPRGGTVLELGDRLMVLGSEAVLEALRPPPAVGGQPQPRQAAGRLDEGVETA